MGLIGFCGVFVPRTEKHEDSPRMGLKDPVGFTVNDPPHWIWKPTDSCAAAAGSAASDPAHLMGQYVRERRSLLCGRCRTLGAGLEVGDVCADGRDGGFLVLGVVDVEPGEDVQGVLPVCAGLLWLVQRVVGVGESIVGA